MTEVDLFNCDSIEVSDTPLRDNPAYGSVSIRVEKSNHSTIQRLTRHDAEILRDKLTEYLEIRS